MTDSEAIRAAYIAAWIESERWYGGETDKVEARHVRGAAEQEAGAYLRSLGVAAPTS